MVKIVTFDCLEIPSQSTKIDEKDVSCLQNDVVLSNP